MRAIGFVLALGLLGANARGGRKAARVEIKLPHKGQVFGRGGKWDEQYAREALQIFNDLKPDPAHVARLKSLPDNTWLYCSPKGDQVGPRGRSETPMVYMPDYHASLFHGGCGDPGYSSDTWVYHTGANRWVQMHPNFVKCSGAAKYNKGPYPANRPGTRCSLGLTYDTDRKLVVLRGGANAGVKAGRITWEYDPATNKWAQAAGGGIRRYEANCLGFAPGLGTVEIEGDYKTKAASTWVYRSKTKSWGKVATRGAPPGAMCSRLVWAAGQKQLLFWNGSLWGLAPGTMTWKSLSPEKGPRPGGFYRQGMVYDSANDVIIMFGTKDASNKMSQGPWIYSFAKKTWTDMKPAKGPWKGSGQSMMASYDSEYNVLVIAGSSRGTWVYRYKKAAFKKGAKR